MAIYGLVAGKNSDAYANALTKANTMLEFPKTWRTTVDLKDSLLRGGGMSISNYNAVLVLDSGFRNGEDAQVMAEDFVALQDVFQSQSIHGTKLYLITNNSNLYRMLEGSVNGVSGTYYDDVEVFVTKKDIKSKMIVDTLQGAHDGKGLYNREAKKISREERLEKESEEFIEDARSVSKEVLQYGVDTPVSELSDNDYIDSDKNQRQVEVEKRIAAEREKVKERQRKELERLNEKERKQIEAAKGRKNPALNRLGLSKEDKEFLEKEKGTQTIDLGKPDVQVQEPHVPVYRPQTPTEGQKGEVGKSIHISNKDVRVGVPSAQRLRELFQTAVKSDSYISEDKLASDEGIISFIGANNSGCSGLVANVADMYAMVGRKVLVVDLDINKRTQTLYFKNYERAVREHKGISSSLLKVAQGGEIENAAVSVTSRVDVLSVSRDDVVDEAWADTVGAELGTFLADAKEVYDVVLIDIPLRNLGYYARYLGVVDKNVFVVENTMLAIEDFFAITLAKFYSKDKLMLGELISKSSVILNKYKRGRRDEEGYELTHKRVKKMLESAGSPYDKMMVAGEIPYYENWEEQFFTGVRYIWKDDIALRVFKSIFTKAIV